MDIAIDCGSVSDEEDIDTNRLFGKPPITLFNPQSAEQAHRVSVKSKRSAFAMHAKTPQPQKTSGWGRIRLFATNSAKSTAEKASKSSSNTSSRSDKDNNSNGIGLKKIMAKIGSVFTPHAEKPFSDSAVSTINSKKSFEFNVDHEIKDHNDNDKPQNGKKHKKNSHSLDIDSTPQPSMDNDEVADDLYETQKA